MKIAVITNEALKMELLAQMTEPQEELLWLNAPVNSPGIDCYIDLLFESHKERIEQLRQLPATFILVNSVINTLADLPENFVRINGWLTFLQRPWAECSCKNESLKSTVEKVMSVFHKKATWVPDKPGFISSRVVSMIINEAYLALEENVSSKAEIDIAMKLGTNYPFGPFEWSEKIGLKNVYDLLSALAKKDKRYQPCALMKKEITE